MADRHQRHRSSGEPERHPRHLSRILNGHAGITADMALRLAAALPTCAELWLAMQTGFDLWKARQNPRP